MKTPCYKIIAVLLFMLLNYSVHAQKTAMKIGTNPTIKDPSAILELESANKGTLLTRVALNSTIDNVTPIVAPVNGLTVFNTATAGTAPNNVTPGYYFWSTADARWVRVKDDISNTDWSLTGNAGTNPTNNYLGTSDAQDLSIRTGGTEKVRITSTGNMGLGITSPSTKLDVNGTTRTIGFTMPTGAAQGAVLTSDASGNGTWQTSAISNVVGFIGNSGVNIPHTTTQYLHTGNTIVLPPGRYAVNISMLMSIGSGSTLTPANSSFWLRTTFSDISTGFPGSPNPPTPTLDIQGGPLTSGLLPGSSYFGLVNGTIIINNTSGFNKVYFYIAGNCTTFNTTQTISNFGSSGSFENRIIAYKIN